MMLRLLSLSHVVLALAMSLFITGCASIQEVRPHPVVSQSYDLPGTLEANAVIRAVEQAFVRTLAMQPRILEGGVPSPLPARPAHFKVENRLVYLDRLGMISIPEVICPESMAIVRASAAGLSETSGPHSYVGCIQAYAGAYRIHIIDSVLTVLEHHNSLTGSVGTEPESHQDPLSRLVRALLEQVSDARLVTEFLPAETVIPVSQVAIRSSTDQKTVIGKRVAQDAVSTLPLVCLGPRYESAPVRAARGEGHVITMLDRGSIKAVAEPVDPSYFLVELDEGMAGWVNGSDVRRLPCPIG
jgi:hypothetical protein